MKDALLIPIPPTGNHLYNKRVVLELPTGNGNLYCPRCRGAIRGYIQQSNTADYTAWRTGVALLIKMRYRQHFTEPVVIFYWIFGGKGFIESRDHDNVQKAIGDAFKDADILRMQIVKKGIDMLGGDDDVRYVKGWRPWYFNREEHLTLLNGKGPKRADQLVAKCYIQIVAASALDPLKV